MTLQARAYTLTHTLSQYNNTTARRDNRQGATVGKARLIKKGATIGKGATTGKGATIEKGATYNNDIKMI